MAITASAVTPTTVGGAVVSFGSKIQKRTNKVYIGRLNSYGGLKAHNNVMTFGMPVCTEQCFANVVSSLKAASNGKRRGGGGAFSSKCSKVEEIFTIAAIMNGLVLVGVAIGFVLLRIEAWVEESESG